MSYTKLASSILTSTVWMENDHTRLVWLTMLAMADRYGEVQASIPGLANVARVPVDSCRAAIAKFLAPDPDSRTKTDEGVRIEEIDGGWFVVNHDKYRNLSSGDDRSQKSAERQRRYRERLMRNGSATDRNGSATDRNGAQQTVTEPEKLHQICHAEAEAEAEAEAVFPALRPEIQNTAVPVAGDFSNPRAGRQQTRSSIFAKLTTDDLKNPLTIADWFRVASHRENPVVSHSQVSLLNVLGAAVRALRPGKAKKNPVAMFADIVRNGRWGDVTQADEDAARKQMTVDVLKIVGL